MHKIENAKRKTFKKFALAGVLLMSGLLLSGCFKDEAETTTAEIKKEIVFGTTVGDFSTMVREKVGPMLEKQGYKVKLIEFSDYVRPNLALAEGALDINIFQHKPYLDSFKAQHNLAIEEAFQIPTAPYGLYGGKVKSLEGAYKGMKVSAPNDPSNYARVLVILDYLGWIKLKENIDPLTASRHDIAENPMEIEIITLEAPQLPRSLQDVDFSAINGNFAISAGLNPKDAVFKEPNFTFVNWSAVRSEDRDSQWLKDVTEAFNSDEFKAYSAEKFEGYQLPEIWGN
ncbi:MetQ/NlpA family ABC transporter substrate-binding protein [Ignatzschineria rhizosphaerae]|uniref:MetQ/NlpA family ABC transporter substrate-binding protein n=1 Tax=Ignatzschineria rhizosphaerae TaxID=2923279 RepID=A0ABY3X4V8_9GAMM|nr:MetQ/NlpA family ABC transporter substrate-binding protein [Ignatzschineria rhizosphaerae]UNM97310.1 MetQ/NlpA family ABC transporter substrate-binding protein [Ignatzschineria rhizosphaerae]